LRLNRHIKCGNSFIADQETWLHGQRARDADALSLTARELMGITPLKAGVQANAPQDVIYIVCLARPIDQTMH